MRKSQKHIVIVIAFGPEVRAFVYSGLAERLAREHRVTIVTPQPKSQAFQRMPHGVSVVQLPTDCESRLMARMRTVVTRAHGEWLNARGRRRWRHYISSTTPAGRQGFKRALYRTAAVTPLMYLGHAFARLYGRLAGTDRRWARFLHDQAVDCVLVSSFASQRTLPALQTAANIGIPTVVVTNSWKDAYTSPYLHVVPTVLAVWDDQIALDLADANPWLSGRRVLVTGSLHLQRFLQPTGVIPRPLFCETVGLDPQKQFLCYTAAAPAAVVNEELLVDEMLKALAADRGTADLQVLLRLNPMEDGRRFQSLTSKHAHLVLQKPRWEWKPELDWCCPLADDMDQWVSTVYHASVAVSIPSTVTLEFAAFGKPVINVCFDWPQPHPLESSNRRFWEADFYREVRRAHVALPAFSVEELVARIKGALGANVNAAYPPPPTNVQTPVDKLVSAVLELVNT